MSSPNDDQTRNVAILENELRDLLAGMNAWEDPYTEFYTRGVTGNRTDAFSCVITNYLTANLDGAEVVTSQFGVQAYTSLLPTDLLPIGRKLLDFLDDFDNGYFPELETTV